jgi:hypothetical protein
MPDLIFRRATEADVAMIVGLLADDVLGASREATGAESYPQYLHAFRAIDADPNQFLLVVDDGTRIVGTLQLTFIPGLASTGLKAGKSGISPARARGFGPAKSTPDFEHD